MTGAIQRFAVRLLVMALVAAAAVSCRTPGKIPEAKLRPYTAPRLFKKASENSFRYHSFSIRKATIQVDNGRIATTFRAGIQAVRDSFIMVSLSKLNILLARVMLTPDSVLYVNYFNRSYYAGDYSPVGSLLDFDLDFALLQAIVSADIFSVFDDEKTLREFKTWVEEGQYVLQSESSWKINRLEDRGRTHRIGKILKRMEDEIPVVQTCYLDPSLFVVNKLILEELTGPRKAELTFGGYEQVDGQYFPSSLDVNILSDKGGLKLAARLSGFSTEAGSLNLPEIPPKYERVFLP